MSCGFVEHTHAQGRKLDLIVLLHVPLQQNHDA